jgi:hypothetical protein
VSGVVEEMNGGRQHRGILISENIHGFSLPEKLDEALILGGDEKVIERESPEHPFRRPDFIQNLPEGLFVFFDLPDLGRDVDDLQFMLRKLLLDEVDILHGHTEVTFWASVQNRNSHGDSLLFRD